MFSVCLFVGLFVICLLFSVCLFVRFFVVDAFVSLFACLEVVP